MSDKKVIDLQSFKAIRELREEVKRGAVPDMAVGLRLAMIPPLYRREPE